MAQTGTISLRGRSGSQYPFNIYDFNGIWGEVPAVYVFTRVEGTTHRIIYIGQTDNLRQRLDNHHKALCISSNNANRLCVHQEGDENTRLMIETDLIRNYKTPCNS